MAEIAAPTAAPAPAVAKPPRKLALRLDNGTVIRATDSTEPTVLKPKAAWEAGMLDESHLLKMQALLCELHAKLPEEGPLKSISIGSKRSLDSVLEVNQAISTKRSHSVGDVQPAVATAPSFGGDAADWIDRCKQLVAFLLSPSVLDRESAIVFRNPPNVQLLPNYPKYIKEPMWFDKILDKLNTGAYAAPGEVYNDILLICDNCYRFNVEAYPSEYGFIGVKLENTFLAAWGKTPFAATTPPRALRPPPPKLPSHPPKKPQQAKSNGGAPRGGGGFGSGRGRGRPGRPPGVARTKSVNSYGAYGAPAPVFTKEMQQALIDALHDPAVLEANMQGVVDILNAAGEMGMDEDGEATLDLEIVTPPTAAKLYELVVVKTGRAPVPGAVGATAPGKYVQMERDSDDDWDMEDE